MCKFPQTLQNPLFSLNGISSNTSYLSLSLSIRNFIKHISFNLSLQWRILVLEALKSGGEDWEDESQS